MSQCYLCKADLPDVSRKSRVTGRRCKLCDRKQSQKYYYQHRDRERARLKRNALQRKYGLTIEQYQEVLKAQGGKCKICNTEAPGGRWNSFHIDHCHVTKKIRGILCSRCNIGLGYFKDSPKALTAAIEYLKGML